MTKESAGYRCDVQRQTRAAAVDLADSVRRLAGLVRPVDRRHGSLGAPGGDLIWSHWEGMDDGGMLVRRANSACHTIDGDGVSPRLRPGDFLT